GQRRTTEVTEGRAGLFINGAEEIMRNELYLDLLEKCLLGLIFEDAPLLDFGAGSSFQSAIRADGRDWPSQAHSMIGFKRMRSLRTLCEEVIRAEVPGDFIETGVWRGGSCILMRGILKSYDVANRTIWVADSFEGLPPPEIPQDAGDQLYLFKQLAISLQQ